MFETIKKTYRMIIDKYNEKIDELFFDEDDSHCECYGGCR